MFSLRIMSIDTRVQEDVTSRNLKEKIGFSFLAASGETLTDRWTE